MLKCGAEGRVPLTNADYCVYCIYIVAKYFFFHLEPLFNVVQRALDSGYVLSLATLLKGMYRIYIFGNCAKENVFPIYPWQLC